MNFPCMKLVNLNFSRLRRAKSNIFALLPYAGAKNSVCNMRRIPWTTPAAGAKNFDLGTLFPEIVDCFVEIVDFFTEIVDTHLFVESVLGGLDNRRHVSTIH